MDLYEHVQTYLNCDFIFYNVIFVGTQIDDPRHFKYFYIRWIFENRQFSTCQRLTVLLCLMAQLMIKQSKKKSDKPLSSRELAVDRDRSIIDKYIYLFIMMPILDLWRCQMWRAVKQLALSEVKAPCKFIIKKIITLFHVFIRENIRYLYFLKQILSSAGWGQLPFILDKILYYTI